MIRSTIYLVDLQEIIFFEGGKGMIIKAVKLFENGFMTQFLANQSKRSPLPYTSAKRAEKDEERPPA